MAVIAGLQTFDENGKLLVDLTGNYPKQLGVIETGEVNGFHDDPRLAEGEPWVYLHPLKFNPNRTYPLYPQVLVSGTRISWEFNRFSTLSGLGRPVGAQLVYGFL